MQKIIVLLKKLFSTKVEQRIEVSQTEQTTITQVANIYNFLLPGLVLAMVLLLLGYWGYTQYRDRQYNLTPMASGNLNVVIVPFLDQTDGKCGEVGDIGLSVASAFYTLLSTSKYDETSQVRPAFRSSDEIPLLKGDTNDELTKSAEELARQINAQIIVYGSITCSEITKNLSANVMFFVAPTGFSDAQELIGDFSFNATVLYGDFRHGQDFLSLNKNLLDKIQVMSLVINSIGSFLGENYEQALNTISYALVSPLWENEDGKEVIYIIAGNIAVRYAQQLNLAGEEHLALNEAEQARDFYLLANEISVTREKGGYARAYIGLAGVEHFYATYKSQTSCQVNDIDEIKLNSEKKWLADAEKAKNRSITADIPEKIAFGRAQIDLTLYTLDFGSVDLEGVKNNFNLVINSYEGTGGKNLRIQEIAAHSYSGLALTNWLNGDFQEVEENFNLAVTTTESPSLQAVYLKSLGDYYANKQIYKKALVYYKESMKIREQFDIKFTNCEPDLKNIIKSIEESTLP